jgi:hypothetical protein
LQLEQVVKVVQQVLLIQQEQMEIIQFFPQLPQSVVVLERTVVVWVPPVAQVVELEIMKADLKRVGREQLVKVFEVVTAPFQEAVQERVLEEVVPEL